MTTDSGTYDQSTLARKQAMAQALLGQTLKPEENVKHWAQGLANLAKAGIGGYMGYQANQDAAAEKAKGQAELYTALGLPAPAAPAESPGMFSKIGAALSGGGGPAPETPVAPPTIAGLPSDQASYPPPPAPGPAPVTFRPGITAPQPTGAPDFSKAIAGIESGGAYDKLGPQTKTGDRAFGKYQVMGNNIPEWTTQVLGKPMTPEQFVANPDAQEAVFKAKFGDYVQKYGPEGAAKAWFAGEKGMNNPNAKDVLGTTVAGYGQKFTNALGPQAAPQVAAALTAPTGDTALPPGATPAQGALPSAESVKGGALSGIPQDTKLQIAKLLSSNNPTAKAMGTALLQNAISDKVTYQTTPDGDILAMDPHGRAPPKVVYKAGAKPIAVPENSQLYDPTTKSFIGGGPAAIPASVPGPGGASVPVPQGLSPRDARKFTEKIAESTAAASIPPDYKEVQKMREDFVQLPAYKNLAQAAPIYNSMREAAGRDTKAADLNMVYGLGKIMDPTSVVREGEIHMAEGAQGLQERLNGMIAQIQSRGALTPAGREAIMAEAHGRVTSYKNEFDRDAGRFKGIAERSRVNPADVIPEFGSFEPWTAPKAKDDAVTTASPPAGVDAKIWQHMTPEERALWK